MLTRRRIICVSEKSVADPLTHLHLSVVGVGPEPGTIERLWTTTEVIREIQSGAEFFTRGLVSQQEANVVTAICPHCGATILQSDATAVEDNKLQSLRFCTEPK